MLISDQDNNYIEIDDFENKNLSISGDIYNYDGVKIENSDVDSWIKDLQQILLDVDNFVFSKKIENM